MRDGVLKVPETVSYFELLVELQHRTDEAHSPDDLLYFTELSLELIEAYRLSKYRVFSLLERSLALPPPGEDAV
jgi:hypothetical protein